jgi:hypothetical protein
MEGLKHLKIHPPPPLHHKVKHKKLGEEGNLLFFVTQELRGPRCFQHVSLFHPHGLLLYI